MAGLIDEIELYALSSAGWSKQELADYFGVHRATIHRHEVELGLAPGVGGPTRKELCGAGLHPMTEENAIEIKSGGRACRACKQRRDRAYQRRKRAQ